MHLVNSNATARQSPQTLEWQVCEDERDWDVTQHELAAQPNQQKQTPTWVPRSLRRWRLPLLGLLLVLASLGASWIVQRAEAGVAEVAREVEAEVVADLWRDKLSSTTRASITPNRLNRTTLSHEPSEVVTHVEVRDLGVAWAMVEVFLKPSADDLTYRQTRVYREEDRGWVRVEPTAARWVLERRLESEHFFFVYHAVDEEAVRLAAPQLDELYPVLSGLLVQEQPAMGKPVITVDPMQKPGRYSREGMALPDLVVSSPAALLLSSDMAPSDVLVQSVSLALYNQLASHTFAQYHLPGQWYHLTNGLRLWFIWEHELPLAKWRKPLMQWIFATPREGHTFAMYDVPAFAQELCAHHNMWMDSPGEVNVPILCWHSNPGNEMANAWPLHDLVARISFTSLLYKSNSNMDGIYLSHDNPLPEPGPFAIVLATGFEYVTAAYGSAMVPSLLAAIPQHEQAETLIPAVFGVSLATFEQGWRAFLVEQYALDESLVTDGE